MKFNILKTVPFFALTALITSCGGNSDNTDITTETFTEITETTEISTDTISETESITVNIETSTIQTTAATVQETTSASTTAEVTQNVTTSVQKKTEQTKQPPKEQTKETPKKEEVNVPKETPKKEEVNAPKEALPEPAVGSLGVTFNGKKVMLNTDINLSGLGEADNFSSAPSCNYDGLDKVFTYNNVSVYTYPYDNRDFINEIEVNNVDIATDKGIKPIGQTLDDIKATYGEPTEVDSSMYKYVVGNSYTYFCINDNTVSYWGVVCE